MSMDKNWILITGCSTGIGRAAVFGLVEGGFRVIPATRTQTQADELRLNGLTSVVIDNDDPESIANGWRQAVEIAGSDGISGLFANAGFGLAGALEDVSWDAMEAQFRTNVFGTHELVRLAVRHMREHGGGRVVICSSVLGLVGMKMRGAYVSSKFALEGLADVWTNIRVCLLEPGPVMTQFRANSLKAYRKYIDRGSSHYEAAYETLEARLSKLGAAAPFTAQAEECVTMLVHALTAKFPKPRYQWTVQTRVFSALKRLLPTRVFDILIAKG